MSVDTRKNISSPQRRGIRSQSSEVADWTQATCTIMLDAVIAAANRGGAIRFGYSKDGGAYAVGIYGDGEPYTEFVRPSEDIDKFLCEVKQYFDDLEVVAKPATFNGRAK